MSKISPTAPAAPSRRQVKVGKVISDKMQKTIVVAVESFKKHEVYKKSYRVTKHFKAHDEENSARIGDRVRIEECRPLSKDKRWRLVEIILRADQGPSVAEVSVSDVNLDEEEEEAE